MRLTCPNCGAVYEVPDEVIPDNGRDVQCSNCGDTWFQTHPDHPGAGPADDIGEAFPEPESDWDEEVEAEAPPMPEPAPEPEPEPEPEMEPEFTAPRRALDEDISSVLREEAEREQQAREEERRGGEEPDPVLTGSENADEAERRLQEAQARMARLRGLEPDHADIPAPEAEIDMGSRRNLLPDIEDIGQRIENNADQSTEDTSARDGSRVATQKEGRGGFGRGMRYAILLAVLGTALYMTAPQLSDMVPAMAEPIGAYVQFIDGLRDMLQAQAGGLLK